MAATRATTMPRRRHPAGGFHPSLADLTISAPGEPPALTGPELGRLVRLATAHAHPAALTDPRDLGLRLRGLAQLVGDARGEIVDEAARYFVTRALIDLAAIAEAARSSEHFAVGSKRVPRRRSAA